LVIQEKQCGHPIDKNHCTTRCTTMAIYKLLKLTRVASASAYSKTIYILSYA